MKKLIFIFTLLLLTFNAMATIIFEDGVIPELAPSGRALAMGNAYLCLVDDSSSVFYNPAGLGSVRGMRFHLSNFHIEANSGWLKAGTSGFFTSAISNFAKGFSLDGSRELLLAKPGLVSHSRIHAMPNITFRNISFGFLYSMSTRAQVTTDATSFDFADRTDYGPYAAFNLSFFGGILKLGMSGILLIRSELIGSVDPNTPIALTSDDYKKGTGIVYTAGTKLTLPFMWLPTFSAVMHNASGAKFTAGSSGAGAPDKIAQSVDVGFGFTPQVGKTVRLHFEVNMRDALNEIDTLAINNKLQGGMEIDIARRLFFRMGYGDTKFAMGIGFRTRQIEFDLTSYGIKTHAQEDKLLGLPAVVDRRYSISISAGF